MHRPIRFAPEQVLAAATLVAVLVAIVTVWLATHGPSLGFSLQVQGEHLVAANIRAKNSGSGITAGTVVVGLATASSEILNLSPADLTPEPDVTYNNSTDYRAFLQRQNTLAGMLATQNTVVITGSGERIPLQTVTGRPLSSLSWAFWLQLVCGLSGFLMGMGVWAYRQQSPAVHCYALTGVGLMLAALSAAVYSSRELALPLWIFEPLRVANQTGTLIYAGAFAAVLWHYPTRLNRLPVASLLVGLYAVLSIAAWRMWWPTLDLTMRLPALLGFCLAIIFAVAQWRRSKADTLARASLRWFLFSWLAGSGLFLALIFVPPLFGINTAHAQAPAFVLLLVIHLALAVGILNYRLFDLDQWWYSAMLVGLSGLLVYALDMLLVVMLGVTAPLALGAALAVVGWLYFPARQWIWSRLTRHQHSDRQPALIRMVTNVLSHPETSADQAWQNLLEQVFMPRSVEFPAQLVADAVAQGGLALEITADNGLPQSRLLFCHGGARLFNSRDLEMLADLKRLFAELLDYRQRLDQAVATERDRVARDLHDDVGARLLTLSHRLPQPGADQARQALAELRAVVYSMRAPPAKITELLGDWRVEAAERCDAAGITLVWQVQGKPPPLALTGGPALALSRVLRETLSNALNHSGAQKITLDLAFSGTQICTTISHPYNGEAPGEWRESLGLHNLRDRIAQLHGEIAWHSANYRLECCWSVDLAAAAELNA